LKIWHIIVGLNVGGAELMLKRLIESHEDNTEYQHLVISLTDVGVVGRRLQALGIEVVAMQMLSVRDIPRILWQLTRLIRAGRPDVVQTWMYHADLLGGLAARFAGNKKIIWGIRTTEVRGSGSRATTLVRKLCAWLSHVVPDTIVCAAHASRRAHEAVGYDAKRMEVVSNGFDLSLMVAAPEQRVALRLACGYTEEHVVIGTLGRFNPDKDHANFVRAAGLLAREHAQLRFLMVGRGLDPANMELARWIADTGKADCFVLLGERADVAVCLATMDIFCLSSRTEGFPNVVGEAMSMGVPCVVTDVGDADMLVADTGIVVPRNDSRRLAQALEQMLRLGADGYRRLGLEAKQRIQSEFTIARARERFESIYQRLVKKGVH